MLGRTASRPRALLLLAALLVFGVLCAGRLAYWQLVRHDWLLAQAREQVTVQTEIPAERGTIYDREGEPLAVSVEARTVFANPYQVKDKAADFVGAGSAAFAGTAWLARRTPGPGRSP